MLQPASGWASFSINLLKIHIPKMTILVKVSVSIVQGSVISLLIMLIYSQFAFLCFRFDCDSFNQLLLLHPHSLQFWPLTPLRYLKIVFRFFLVLVIENLNIFGQKIRKRDNKKPQVSRVRSACKWITKCKLHIATQHQ